MPTKSWDWKFQCHVIQTLCHKKTFSSKEYISLIFLSHVERMSKILQRVREEALAELQPGESVQTKMEIIFQPSLSKVRSISAQPKRIIHSCTNFTKQNFIPWQTQVCPIESLLSQSHTSTFFPWHYFAEILPMSPNIPFASMFLRLFFFKSW